MRWVDVQVPCAMRTCGKELTAQTKEALLAHELFSAMPSVGDSQVFAVVSRDGRSVRSRKQLDIGIFDISRARFMSKADRELFRENADEARAPGESDVVGRLSRSTYGIRDASNNWMRHWQGKAAGKANPRVVLQHTANFARCSSRRRLLLSCEEERSRSHSPSGDIQVQSS